MVASFRIDLPEGARAALKRWKYSANGARKLSAGLLSEGRRRARLRRRDARHLTILDIYEESASPAV